MSIHHVCLLPPQLNDLPFFLLLQGTGVEPALVHLEGFLRPPHQFVPHLPRYAQLVGLVLQLADANCPTGRESVEVLQVGSGLEGHNGLIKKVKLVGARQVKFFLRVVWPPQQIENPVGASQEQYPDVGAKTHRAGTHLHL